MGGSVSPAWMCTRQTSLFCTNLRCDALHCAALRLATLCSAVLQATLCHSTLLLSIKGFDFQKVLQLDLPSTCQLVGAGMNRHNPKLGFHLSGHIFPALASHSAAEGMSHGQAHLDHQPRMVYGILLAISTSHVIVLQQWGIRWCAVVWCDVLYFGTA